MEYAKGGELFNKVAKGKLKEDLSRKYFQQLISAVAFCHSRGVYRLDLKPENLLRDDGNIKVSDFGLSALAESKRQDGLLHTTCGHLAMLLLNLNAFDIISFSIGFDLSEENDSKKETGFTSRQTAKTIISKLEEIANRLRLKVAKKYSGLLKFEGLKAGRKGVLSIDAEIFEGTPNFHLVEVKMSIGDTLEYQQVVKQDIRPALKDIVWAWQGNQVEKLELQPSQVVHVGSAEFP
ncbi:hypothetical protein ACH5RR_005132 [Cinchona calisaya]|uniref:non-specific serine/threonine protein kinase n=1 Tax=Cinchona calisaya TaxID=153742 RepID=A0ABD3AKD5_9GENT